MSLFLAILWTFVLALDIISCVGGTSPTWITVFCPLIALVVDRWIKYLEDPNK